MKKWVYLLSLAFALLGAVAAPVQELYPFDIVGRIVNADNVAYDASAGIVMRVRDANGRLLAQTVVRDPGGNSPWNFVLEIPIASERAIGYAMTGDAFQLSAKLGDKVYTGLIASEDATIGKAGDRLTLKVMLAEDVNGNGIADSYEEAMLDEMWAAEIDGDYDPEADYDGDGVSNRAEYLAGTDPFDADDFFHVVNVAATESSGSGSPSTNLFAITFEANAGRSYGVLASSELTETADGAKPDWRRAAFRLSRDDADEVRVLSNDSKTWTIRTVYLLRQGDKRFFKVEQELDE